MSRVITSLMMVLLSFSFLACTQRPVFTVDVLKPTTPSPLLLDPTLTAVPPLESPTLVATATPPQMPVDFTPIMYGKKYDANTFFLLLGGVREGVWVAPDLAFANFSYLQGWEYDVYTRGNEKYQVYGYPPQFSSPYKIYTVDTDATLDEAGMLAVARGWPALQRNVQELTSDHGLYRQAVLDWLLAEGIDEPQLGTLQILRVDIEGDGVDEIFIGATLLDESQHTTRAGDHSIILMRKVVGNKAVTLPVVGDIYRSTSADITYPRTYSLANFIDLNRDGLLEVIVDIRGWESAGAIVYQIDGQDVIESLRVE